MDRVARASRLGAAVSKAPGPHLPPGTPSWAGSPPPQGGSALSSPYLLTGTVTDTTTTTVSESPTSVTYGVEITAVFTVTVKTHYGEPVPNGERATVKVGSATCVVTLIGGKGTCEIANSALSVGSYTVSVAYGGDADLGTSNALAGTELRVKNRWSQAQASALLNFTAHWTSSCRGATACSCLH